MVRRRAAGRPRTDHDREALGDPGPGDAAPAEVHIKNRQGIAVGEHVFVGCNAVLEGCRIENSAFIGMG